MRKKVVKLEKASIYGVVQWKTNPAVKNNTHACVVVSCVQ